MTTDTVVALGFAEAWRGFWTGDTGLWILGRGVPIALLLIGGLLALSNQTGSWPGRGG